MPFEPEGTDGFEPDQIPSINPANQPPLPTSVLPPLTSQWEATKFGAGQAATGAWDTIKGMAQSAVPKGALDVVLGPGGTMLKNLIGGGIDLAKQVPQVPGAIKDIAQSPSPLAALATSAPYAGGQGAATLAMAKAIPGPAKAMTPEDAMGLIRKGVLPKDPDFMPNLKENLPTIAQAEQAGPPVTTKTGFVDMLQKTADAHRAQYEAALKPHEGATVSTHTIKGYQGETLGGEGADATLRHLDNRLNVINNTIRDAKAGVGGAPLGTEGIAPLKAESAAIREVLDRQLMQRSGVDVAPLRAKTGQLNDLARQAQASEIARYNQINRPIDAPTTTKAGVTARVAGAAQRKVFGEPQDAAIRKAFEGLRQR